MSEFRGGAAGPPAAQFLVALQNITIALNANTAGLQELAGSRPANQIALAPVTPPAAPATGSIIYCSAVDGHTYVVNASGTRTQIAP